MLIPEIAKKHCITVNAINADIRDKDAVRRAFLCAFNALPASSPSTPNSSERKWEFFRRFNCNSPVCLIASNGVSLLKVLAGSHAEIHMVSTLTSNVNTSTSG